MNRVSLFCEITIGLLLSAVASAQTSNEQPREIPLDQIWAFKMPGTRDVRELEPKPDTKSMATLDQVEKYYRGSAVHQILRVLKNRPHEQDAYPAGPVFAVAGSGEEALNNAQAIFANLGSTYPDPHLAAGSETTLVFYSYTTGRYVQLVSVEKTAGIITINFRFVQHMSTDMSNHFALIPIGKLAEGVVRVKVNELPMMGQEGQGVKWTGARRNRVCSGTTLIVDK
jgi:hypothetical protein